MKKVVKISILTATVAVAMMFFGGCAKDNTPSLVSGGFNGRVTADVEAEDWNLSIIQQVVPWNEPGIQCNSAGSDCYLLGEQMGDPVSFNNDRFTINLPDPPSSNANMYDIKHVFENILNVSGTLKYSDPNVLVTDIDFLAHTGSSFVGYFLHMTSDKKTTCFYVYAESDVTVTGGSNVSVSLKEGWNRMYHTEGESGKYTTKTVNDLKWFFYDFGI